ASIKDVITCTLILVGKDPASLVYVRNKQKACLDAGINVESHYLEENATQKEVLKIIEEANKNDNVHGILVQLPLPSHLDEEIIINSIDPLKDIDGLTL